MRRSNCCSGVVSALVIGGFTAGNYIGPAVGFRQLGATFDTTSHSAENCMSTLVSDFKYLVDSVSNL